MSFPELKSVVSKYASNPNLVNPELVELNQNMLLFKNEILKDIREYEAKYNSKLSQSSLKNSQRYELYEKKLENLSTRIDQVSSLIVNNTDYTEKINNLLVFKEKIEDNFNVLNSRLNIIIKEYKGSISYIEQMVNENLLYPGIIGSNSKFSNFRNFIDYILDSFKQLNEFKKEVKNYAFQDFKKELGSIIQEIKFSVSNTNQRFSSLIENNIKEFHSKIDEVLYQNQKSMEENENKFNDFKNKINDNLSEYQAKFSFIEKNVNDRYIEQLNVIDNFQNTFIKNLANIKPNYESNIKNNESNIKYNESNVKNNESNIKGNGSNIKNNGSDIKYNESNIKNNESNEYTEDKNNYNYTKIINGNDTPKSKTIIKEEECNDNEDIINLLPSDKPINIIQNISKDNDSLTNTENIINKRENKIKIIVKSNSFEKKPSVVGLTKNNKMKEVNNFDIKNRNKLKKLVLFNNEKSDNKNDNKKDKYKKNSGLSSGNDKKISFKYYHNKEISKNNYSVGTISNLKINKIVFPDSTNKIVRNQTILLKNSSVVENKSPRTSTNNIIPLSTKNQFISNNNILKNTFNIKQINKQEMEKIKGIKISETVRIIDRKTETKFHKGLNPIKIMKKKLDNISLNNFGQIKKTKKRSLTSEGEKDKKDEIIQIGVKKDYKTNMINTKEDVLLINTNTYKANRKIKF